ncbi:MAG: hypothetical protein JSS79_03165 [Bacteroidetes bacterium]|nr:hypothetical protein [Bacteroidota bacterium]
MKRLFFFIVTLSVTFSSFSQSIKTALDYLNFFNQQESAISQKYLSYMSESAHGSKLRRLEQKRKELLGTLRAAQNNATRLNPFKGDTLLKKNYESYISILNSIFNEDYGKIVDMEEIAEQSYDKMEAYLMAQELADQKLDEATERFRVAFEKFAADNSIKLLQHEDKLSQKLAKIGKANQYYHRIYLVFFKVYKQEAYLTDAVQRKDVNAIEQNRTTLLKYAMEAQTKLDTAKPFQRDQSLIMAAKKFNQFAKAESEKMGAVTDYLLKADEFDKLRKVFEAGGDSKSKAEVDNYNQSVKNINKLIDANNQQMQALNKGRSLALDGWNNSVKEFFETYIPKE